MLTVANQSRSHSRRVLAINASSRSKRPEEISKCSAEHEQHIKCGQQRPAFYELINALVELGRFLFRGSKSNDSYAIATPLN